MDASQQTLLKGDTALVTPRPTTEVLLKSSSPGPPPRSTSPVSSTCCTWEAAADHSFRNLRICLEWEGGAIWTRRHLICPRAVLVLVDKGSSLPPPRYRTDCEAAKTSGARRPYLSFAPMYLYMVAKQVMPCVHICRKGTT